MTVLMKKIINTYGAHTTEFRALSGQMAEYAAQKGLGYEWAPASENSPKDIEAIAAALTDGDAVLADTVPLGEAEFAAVRGKDKLLISFGAGYDHIDLEAARRNSVAVARTPGANTQGVAELALALILGCRRRFPQNERIIRNMEEWSAQIMVGETVGSATVGLVGFGAIGKALAKMLTALGCRVIIYARREESLARELGAEYVALKTLLKTADVVSVHVAYNQQTHHLLDRELLGLMKPDAVLVNTARGKIVDENALYDMLTESRIAGAGLDVFGEEPLPSDSPLLKLDNVILSPHAGTNTVQSTLRVFRMAVDIAARFFFDGAEDLLLRP